MKVNLKKELIDLDGTVAKSKTKDGVETSIMIHGLVVQALTILSDKEANMEGDERYKLFKIATRVSDNPEEVDLKSEDITLIKKRVGLMFSPVVVGRIYDILEGEDAS